jgi:hypothetical protein
MFISVAAQHVFVELGCQPSWQLLRQSTLADYEQFLEAQQELQLTVPGHELLELLCELIELGADGSSSSSSGGAVTSSSAAADASRSLQLHALHLLLQQSQPGLVQAVELLRRPHRAEGSSSKRAVHSSSSSSSLDGTDVLDSCMLSALDWLVSQQVVDQADIREVGHILQGKGLLCGTARATADFVVQLTARGVEIAAAAMKQPHEQQRCRPAGVAELPAGVMIDQMTMLASAIVLQFVAAACAAGGPAWQQEVPLQAVVLFGALEQLQGLALAAVNQQDVHDAGLAAAEAVAAHIYSAGGEQQQQQQQRAPREGLLLLVQKVTDIIHLTRQFAELNAALNNSSISSSTSDTSAAGILGSKSCNSSSSSQLQPLPCEALFSPGGPVHSMYPEPATLGAWSQPAAAAAAATASSGGSCVGDEQGLPRVQQQQRTAELSVNTALTNRGSRHADPAMPSKEQAAEQQQQLHRAALEGALLLFQAQEQALQEPSQQLQSSSTPGWFSQRNCQPASTAHYIELLTVAEQVLREAQRMGLAGNLNAQQLMPAVCFGRERLEQLQQQLAQQLQQLGLHPSWHTLHDAGSAAGDASSESTAGSGSEGLTEQPSRWQQWVGSRQQQQQAAKGDVAAAVKAGGQSIR